MHICFVTESGTSIKTPYRIVVDSVGDAGIRDEILYQVGECAEAHFRGLGYKEVTISELSLKVAELLKLIGYTIVEDGTPLQKGVAQDSNTNTLWVWN